MKRSKWRNWLAAGVACAATACSASVGMCQQDVLIPGGPVEVTVRPLDEADKAEQDVLFVLDDEGKKSAPIRVQVPRSDVDGSGKIVTRFVEEVAETAAEAPEGEYWLGLQIAVLPEVAKQQLGVKHGLAVEEVLPDSPAAKAEIKRFDILLKADETPLKEADDLVKSVEGSQGKEIIIAVVRSGKEQTVRVTAAKRPESERTAAVRVPRPELAEEIKRLEEALQKLKTKAGDGSLGLWFARPAVVAPRIEYRLSGGPTIKDMKADFPKNLAVEIRKEGDQPTKVHVKRGDKEWNLTEDKRGISLSQLPDDLRPHVQRLLSGSPGPGQGAPSRVVRVTPEGKVEGELRIDPRAPVVPIGPSAPIPPVPSTARVHVASPVAPASPSARIFSYRTETKEEVDGSKLDAILKKLDQIEDGSIAKLKEEVKQLRKELDEVRTKSPGDRK